MGHTVDTPGRVQHPGISHEHLGRNSDPPVLVPEKNRNQRWQNEAKRQLEPFEVSGIFLFTVKICRKFLEFFGQNLLFTPSYHRIRGYVTHVDQFALSDDLGMFFHHEPTTMRKEEAPRRVMGIGIGV